MDSVQLRVVVLFKKGIIIFLLLLTSCSYDTKIVCNYRWHHEMTMKKLMQRCNYIPYGDVWVIKEGGEWSH